MLLQLFMISLPAVHRTATLSVANMDRCQHGRTSFVQHFPFTYCEDSSPDLWMANRFPSSTYGASPAHWSGEDRDKLILLFLTMLLQDLSQEDKFGKTFGARCSLDQYLSTTDLRPPGLHLVFIY